MPEKFWTTLKLWIGALLIAQSIACGTILYPERKGQINGRIDVGVALFDGIGLLFFIIPGVIAYAVDFTNGTIYLPPGSPKNSRPKKSSLQFPDLKQVRFDPRSGAADSVERIIREETGLTVKMNQKDMIVLRLRSPEDLLARFK